MRSNRTLCYVLVFDQIDIIQKSIESITRFSSRMDIVIIENPSDNSPKIKEIIDTFAKSGSIKRHYLFKKNITSRAYDIILEHEKEILGSYKYVIVSDGDISSSDDWLSEELLAMRLNKKLFCIGITFDKSNLPVKTFPEATGWVPPDISKGGIGFREALTGMHLVMFRSSQLIDFLTYKTIHAINFVDSNIKSYVYEVLNMKWGRTKKSRAIHLTWSLYQDLDHPYTKLKTDKSFHDTWYHSDSSEFTVRDFT